MSGFQPDFHAFQQQAGKHKLQLLSNVFSEGRPVDVEQYRNGIEAIYLRAGLGSPMFWMVRDPAEAILLINHIVHGLALEPAKIYQMGIDFNLKSSFARSLSVDNQIWSWIVREVAPAMRDSLAACFSEDQVRILKRSLWNDLTMQCYQQLLIPVLISLRKSCRTGTPPLRYVEPAVHMGAMDMDWVYTYTFLNEGGFPDHEPFEIVARTVRSGVFASWCFNDFVVACPFPEQIVRNERFELHNEEGPALVWPGGYRQYFWNGIPVPEKVIENPHTVTREDIISETNAEVRRCIQEALGGQRFGSLLGLVELDRSIDRHGHPQILFRTGSRDQIAENFIYYVRVTCPSTLRLFYLCVPPMDNARRAVAWTFGKDEDNYRPLVES